MRKRTAARPRLVTPPFVAVLAATFVYFLAVGTVFPVVPRYVTGPLHGGSVAVGIAVGSFSVSAVILRPLAGRLADRYGRRPLIVTGAAIVAFAVLGYELASSVPVLVAFRLMNGVGEALFFTAAATAVNDLAPDERRGEAVSLFSLGLYAGIAIGPLLGELVLGTGHFHAVWALSAGLAAAACLLGLRVPDTRVEGAEPGSGRLLHPAAVLPGLVIASSVWGFSGFSAFVPLYALALGLSGSRFLFLTYASIVLGIRLFGARLPDRLGPRRTTSISLAVSAVGLVVMGTWRSVTGLFVGTALFSVGQALAFPALMALAVARVPASERGALIGTFTAFVDIAFGLGPITLGAVVAVSDEAGGFLASAVVAVGGLALLRSITRGEPGGSRRHDTLEECPPAA